MKEEIAQIILTGNGYNTSISPAAEAQKVELLTSARAVTIVTDAATCEVAREQIKALSAHRVLLEKSRAEVKKPVLEVGKEIDKKAKEFGAETEFEEKRIEKLIQGFAAEEERKRRVAAAEAQRLADEARKLAEQEEKKRRDAELASQAREESNRRSFADIAAAANQKEELEQAQAQTQEAQAVADRAAIAAASVATATGAKPALDFEIVDLAELYRINPDLVALAPKRSVILEKLKSMQASGLSQDVIERYFQGGITVVEQFKVSRR